MFCPAVVCFSCSPPTCHNTRRRMRRPLATNDRRTNNVDTIFRDTLCRGNFSVVCFLRVISYRWGAHLGTTPSQADDFSSQGSAAEPDDIDDGDGDRDEHSGVHVSPMCSRCRYLTAHPLTPLPSTAPSHSGSSLSLSSSSTSAATAAAADVMLGRYCLCTVNREIQREVLQVCFLEPGTRVD